MVQSQRKNGAYGISDIEGKVERVARSEEIREWIHEYLVDHLELTNEVKAKLAQSWREIAARQ
jgi:hypothetical protein